MNYPKHNHNEWEPVDSTLTPVDDDSAVYAVREVSEPLTCPACAHRQGYRLGRRDTLLRMKALWENDAVFPIEEMP